MVSGALGKVTSEGYEDLAEVLITSAHNMDGSTATKEEEMAFLDAKWSS